MKRWHVLAPDAESAKNLYDDLVNAGIETTHIHVFAVTAQVCLWWSGRAEALDQGFGVVHESPDGIPALFPGG